MSKSWTVKELKQHLNTLPDEAKVIIEVSDAIGDQRYEEFYIEAENEIILVAGFD